MQAKTRISLFLLLVIGLHALPVLSYQGNRQTRWPILAWAMYARSYPPGPVEVMMRRLTATSSNGKEEEVTWKLVGLPWPAFRNAYITPLAKGDSTAASELIHRLNRDREAPVVQLRLEAERFTLADTGVVKEALPVLTYRADPSASSRGTSP
jgi:hypothetical protein